MPSRRSSRAPVAGRFSGLSIAIAISLVLHLALLAVKFVPPETLRFKPPDSALEVILVNARSAEKPLRPDAIAQSDLSGGGEHERGRATSFLPRSARSADGDVLKESQGAVAEPEADRRRLMSQLKQAKVAAAPDPQPKKEAAVQEPVSNVDLSDSVKAIARLEAQIDKQTNDYNARPRRGFIGPNTRGASYAMYYNQWKDKVERIGTVNYPEEARGHIYGDLELSVTLSPDGSIYNEEVNVTRSSGSQVLDRAAKRIVRVGAPYGRFSEDLKREYDIFEIKSTFRFTKGDGFEMRFEKR